jgi:hypothetical protein
MSKFFEKRQSLFDFQRKHRKVKNMGGSSDSEEYCLLINKTGAEKMVKN